MFANQKRVFIKWIVVTVLPLILSGCIVLPEEQGHSRGVSLSSAMKSSASGDRQNLGGNNSQTTYSTIDVAATGGAAAGAGASEGSGGSGDFAMISYENSEYNWQELFDVSYSKPFNNDIQGITRFTLTPVSVENDHNFLGLYIGGGIVDLKRGTLPDLAVDRSWMFDVGLSYRHYLNSSWTTFSPYIAGNVGLATLNWHYRTPIYSGSDTIRSDSLLGAEGSVGFGISTRRDSHVSVFGEIDLGGTVFSCETEQGFDNDVFRNFSYVSVKAGLSVKF